MFTLISPEGEKHELQEKEIASFARARGLNCSNLRLVAQGLRQHHKGWTSTEPPVGFTKKPYAIERYLPVTR